MREGDCRDRGMGLEEVVDVYYLEFAAVSHVPKVHALLICGHENPVKTYKIKAPYWLLWFSRKSLTWFLW